MSHQARRASLPANHRLSLPPTLRQRCVGALMISLIMHLGCTSTDWVRVRNRPAIPLATELNVFSYLGPKPTPRTQQLLRRYDLDTTALDEPITLVTQLQEISSDDPTSENALATAEVAYIVGLELQEDGKSIDALDMFGISVANAYSYLFSDAYSQNRNPYDPQFRQASDIYNGALESALRVVQEQGQLKPGTTHIVETETQQYEVSIECRGPLRNADISELKFISDFEVNGLQNHYRSYGLGVPLIAVHRNNGENPAERYYAPGMSIPVTAFLQVVPDAKTTSEDGKERRYCVLELHDPLTSNNISIAEELVPLETDLSTPLAYGLNDPVFQAANESTKGLLNWESSKATQGLYMLEPYDPEKVPVLMIHGLWDNVVTWMDMFNDLRGTPEIRNHYQFWFYTYPTGQPFWLSAAQLRSELAEVRRNLDPALQSRTLDELVLVGHSMGGLVAKMQTVESGSDYWRLVSDGPSNQLDAPDPVVKSLRDALYFGPNPSIKRVITIASPHRGSQFANGATQWLGRRIITLPDLVERTVDQLAGKGPINKRSKLLESQTSIDSLSPTSPVLALLLDSRPASWVKYHNVIGQVAEEGFLSKVAGKSDGVVTMDSARLNEATSELVVAADHFKIHSHPKTVLEVQRVLLEHLDDVSRTAMQRLPAPAISRLPMLERID